MFIDSFYNATNINIKKFNGFNVFAVDGTTLQVIEKEAFDVAST